MKNGKRVAYRKNTPHIMKMALIIFANQNPVNPNEIEKIRRTVKKQHPEFKLRVYANEDAIEAQDAGTPNEDAVITFTTHDVNYDVWANVDVYRSTHSLSSETIALN